MSTERAVIGVLLLAGLALAGAGSAALGYQAWRSYSGVAEAEPNLEILAAHVEGTFERDGKLCGSSRLASSEGFTSFSETLDHHLAKLAADEARENVGFHCLGVVSTTLHGSTDGYVYQAMGDHFIVQAFRPYLWDPDGKLPRWERRGHLEKGHLEIDRTLYWIEPGGKHFPGHEEHESCLYCEDVD